MPAVKKLHQESEDTSKPAYIWGHMFGGIGAVLSDSVQHFCVPLFFTIQDGLREMASWSEECCDFALSHVVQTIRNGYKAARKRRFLRTASEDKVSEATILEYLRKNIFRLMLLCPGSDITQIIRKRQKPWLDDEDEENMVA